jgi:ureidoglycolate lyase
MSKKLQILELTKENFKEFGTVITSEGRTPDAGDDNFNWFEKLGVFENMDTVSVNILECKQREMKVDKLEFHIETPEAIIPMGGVDVIAVVAPAGELDESRMKAFHIPGDKGVVLNTGVRHFIPYPLVGNANCIIVFKHGTGANDLVMEQLSDEYQLVR